MWSGKVRNCKAEQGEKMKMGKLKMIHQVTTFPLVDDARRVKLNYSETIPNVTNNISKLPFSVWQLTLPFSFLH